MATINFEYAPSPESTAPVKLRRRYEHFIGGEWRKPTGGTYFESISPSTEERLAEVAYGSPEDIAHAVAAARRGHDKYW
ncbi:MAG: aldehyde dehydrogenase family protein, partial [Vulcanimicrobiaceae bacterium]